MVVKAPEVEADLIDAVCRRLRERFGEQGPGWESFVRQYYHWVPPEDLADRGIEDLAGAAVCQWELGLERSPGEVKIRVYNPERDRDGWQLACTVIEVASDDMPFIVDSVNMALARLGHTIHLVIHPVIRVRRDDEGRLIEVLDPGDRGEDAIAESVLHAEVVREPDPERLSELESMVERVLGEVRAAVEDWPAMRERTQGLVGELQRREPPLPPEETDEVKAFLSWLTEDNFVFLGYREYELSEADPGHAVLTAVPNSGLGILRGQPVTPSRRLTPK